MSSAVLLIDGYNLLWAANITAGPALASPTVGPGGSGPSDLARSRVRLLSFLLRHLPEAESARTTVVFDAAHAPPGLPRTATFRGVRIFFASDHDDADAMLEELIAGHPAPRRLTVVSSDHRVQNAARRRRARAIDSDLWFRETTARSRRAPAATAKPTEEVSSGEAEVWLAQFGLDREIDATLVEAEIDPPRERRFAPAPDEPSPSPPPAAPTVEPSDAATAPRRGRANRSRGTKPATPEAAESQRRRSSSAKEAPFDPAFLAEAEELAAGRDPHARDSRWRKAPAPHSATEPPDATAGEAPSPPAAEPRSAARPGRRAARPTPASGDSPPRPSRSEPPSNRAGKKGNRSRRRPPELATEDEAGGGGFNPFPDGYADDLLDRDDR